MRTRFWFGAAGATVAIAAVGAFAATGGPGTITTIAGTGKFGNAGEGGPATKAQLANPHGIALDAQGNLYIADYGNVRIAKVSPNGTLTTFAGSRTRQGGFSGDGGPATAALINTPLSVAVDGQGNVYIGDGFNGRIRKVTRDGTITTIAGSGTLGFSGDGGPATSAQMNVPWGVAVDKQGNVYIADQRNNRVRKVNRAGIITTIAGTGKTSGPLGDGGPATAARVFHPTGLVVDAKGNLYIADSGNNRVRKVTPGGTITTVAGNGVTHCAGPSGPATTTPLCPAAVGLALDARGNLYVADNKRVHKVSGGKLTTFAGPGFYGRSSARDRGPALGVRLNGPRGLAVDPKGNVYISDTGNQRIRMVLAGTPRAAALTLTLGGAGSQRALDAQAVTVTARCNRPCSLVATGSVAVTGAPGALGLTRATGSLAAAGATTLTLRLPATAQSRLRSLLKPGRQARATVTVQAADKAGNRVSKERVVVVLGGQAATAPSGSSSALRTFGSRIQGFLAQSARGRATLRSALGGVFACSTSPAAAGVRVASVTANREGILGRLGTLATPTAEAARIAARLRQALTHSIAADRHYEAWLRYLGGQRACSTTRNADFAAAQREDRLATAAKRSFVAAYNPLARRLGLRAWSADEF